MKPRPRARRLSKPNHVRALELLAASTDGSTEAIMLAHDFTIEQMVELMRSRLPSATANRAFAGSRAQGDDRPAAAAYGKAHPVRGHRRRIDRQHRAVQRAPRSD